eukprot:scaffold9114_cov118-Isochrysis_galbana.AAC.21
MIGGSFPPGNLTVGKIGMAPLSMVEYGARTAGSPICLGGSGTTKSHCPVPGVQLSTSPPLLHISAETVRASERGLSGSRCVGELLQGVDGRDDGNPGR